MLSGMTIMRTLTSMIMEMLKLRSGMPTMQVQMNMILGIPMLRDVRISIYVPSSSTEESDTGGISDNGASVTHTVSLKCIGVTRDKGIQKLLKYIAENLPVQETPVRLNPEPHNPCDNNAIAFEAYVNGRFQRIGYVVKVLMEVHAAIEHNEITSVKFAWVKFVVSWSKGGPNMYAAIDITKRGEWPKNVVRYASMK